MLDWQVCEEGNEAEKATIIPNVSMVLFATAFLGKFCIYQGEILEIWKHGHEIHFVLE